MTPNLQRALVPFWREMQARLLAAPGQARVTSWLRTVTHNRAVGGAPESQHLIGTAVDVVPLAPTTWPEIAAALRGVGFAYVVDEGDHVHAQLFPKQLAQPVIRQLLERGWLL